MAWYKTGTVTVTNGSPNVTLAGGDALQNIFPDDGFFGPDGNLYPVLTIGGSDVIILGIPYAGATAAGAPYLTVPIADYTQLRDLLAQVNALVTGYQDIAVNAGIGLFQPGSAAAPGVRGVGHEGTGLAWNGDDSLSVSVAGTIVATYKSGGGGTVVSPKLEVESATSATTITVISDIVTSLYRSGITFTRTGVAAGSRIETIRDPSLGGVGMKLQTTVDNAAEVAGTYTDSVTIGRKGSVTASVTYSASGDSSTAFRSTLNGGAGGLYISGYSAEANFSHGSEFIAGSNWVARQADSARYSQVGGSHIFYSNIGLTAGNVFTPTERMRVTASGDLGIGVAPAVRLHAKSSAEILRLETTDPRSGGGHCFSTFYDPTGRKGYFGYLPGGGDAMYLVNELAAPMLLTTNGNGVVIESSGNFRNAVDNTKSCGVAGVRWSVVYAGTGTINTSDEREKTWRGGLTEAELRAALRIADEIGVYQWNDAIDEKGADEARLHCGVRAQAVWSIMIDEDLVNDDTHSRYAFLCYDAWEEKTEAVTEDITIPAVIDEDGNEVEPERIDKVATGETRVTLAAGDRYGVRPDQLNSFILAGLNERQKQADDRLAAIEQALQESAG